MYKDQNNNIKPTLEETLAFIKGKVESTSIVSNIRYLDPNIKLSDYFINHKDFKFQIFQTHHIIYQFTIYTSYTSLYDNKNVYNGTTIIYKYTFNLKNISSVKIFNETDSKVIDIYTNKNPQNSYITLETYNCEKVIECTSDMSSFSKYPPEYKEEIQRVPSIDSLCEKIYIFANDKETGLRLEKALNYALNFIGAKKEPF